jgi:HEAT repeat protein
VKKRVGILIASLLVVGLGIALALPRSHYAITGWLNGEAFYQGRPTSYWAGAFRKEPFIGPQGDVGKTLSEGGAAAVPVLWELLKNEDKLVRGQALFAIQRIDWDPRSVPLSFVHRLVTDKNSEDIGSAARELSPTNRRALQELIFRIVKEDPNLENQAEAALSLAWIGAPEAAEALTMTLQQGNQKTRLKAAAALWQLKHDAKIIVPIVEEGLLSEDPGVRRQTMEILGQVGEKYKDAVLPKLLEMAKHQHPQARATALSHLNKFARDPAATQALIRALKDEDKVVRRTAAFALAWRQHVEKEAIPILLESLADSKSSLRRVTISRLGQIGTENDQVARELLHVLDSDEDAGNRIEAASALEKIAPRSEEFANDLIKAAKHDGNFEVRVRAMNALGRIGPPANAAIPFLITAIKEEHAVPARVAAVRSLVTIAKGDDLVPIFVAALQHDANGAVRSAAAESLGKIGTHAPTAAEALKKSLADKDCSVRIAAAEALSKIDPQNMQGIHMLIETLKTKDKAMFREGRYGAMSHDAIAALGRIGPAAKAAVPALIAAVKEEDSDPDHLTAAAAIQTLGKMGPAAKEAIPLLTELLKRNFILSDAAIEALQELGPEAKSAIPALTHEMKSAVGWRRVRAALALCKIDGQGSQYVPVVVECLKDSDPTTRFGAAHALGTIGPAATSAIPSLRAALNDEQDMVRSAAGEALHQIDPKNYLKPDPRPPPFPVLPVSE